MAIICVASREIVSASSILSSSTSRPFYVKKVLLHFHLFYQVRLFIQKQGVCLFENIFIVLSCIPTSIFFQAYHIHSYALIFDGISYNDDDVTFCI